jgi:hypothetical protein
MLQTDLLGPLFIPAVPNRAAALEDLAALTLRSSPPESQIGLMMQPTTLPTSCVWTLVAPFVDSPRATRSYPVDSGRTY